MTHALTTRTGLATLATTIGLAAAGLVVSAPTAGAGPTPCANQAHPITGWNLVDVKVGTTKEQTADLAVHTDENCGVDHAVAVIRSPHRSYRVTLKQVSVDPSDPSQLWAGRLRIDPATLRNSDAGAWTIRYQVSGRTSESRTEKGHVRRASRLSFDASPEPVAPHGQITFRGRLTRADWNTHRYHGVRKPVWIEARDTGGEEDVPLAEVWTRRDGRFHASVRFPGPNSYWAHYRSSRASSTAEVRSRVDRVEQR